jgi:hypothetical protein
MTKEVWLDLDLVCHPDTPPRTVKSVKVQVDRDARTLRLLYLVEGDPGRIRLPAPQKACRADGLWQTTCFELFVRDDSQGYREFNFSPSSQWAAYRFRAYREGREAVALNEPPIVRLIEPEAFHSMLRASLKVEIAPGTSVGLSAIIEETDGTKSYWALAHPPGDKPDFHDPACFALELPPAAQS